MLLQYGADIFSADKDGLSPIDIAMKDNSGINSLLSTGKNEK